MIHETRAIAAEGEAIDLDPFAFWPDVASRLVGFGGEEPSDNPDYAFHTLYISCGTGPIVFTVRFAGLQAQRGTLILRVHELPEVMGANARQIAISQTQLTDLIRGDGIASLPAFARAGAHYALLGYIYGDTVAAAAGLTIDVARRTPDPNDPDRQTSFRAESERVAAAVQVVGEREGTLVTPVSQLCTIRQVREPVLGAIIAQLGALDDASPIDRWEQGYIARVLDRYDVAQSGSTGLGIGGLHDRLAPWLVQHGCTLLLTTPGEVPADIDLPPGVEACHLNPADIDGLVGFDFAWATRGGGVGGGDRQELLRFIENTLRTLKPGGLMGAGGDGRRCTARDRRRCRAADPPPRS